MNRTKDTIQPYGFLEISKIYSDGTEELVFDERNVITSGMAVGLSHLFSASGGTSIENFQILNFQVGVSGDINTYGVSSFKLVSGLSQVQYESSGSEAFIELLAPIENGSVLGSNKAFVRIPFNHVEKVTKTSVRFILVLDRYTANGVGVDLNEVGLFMRNPRGLAAESPILVAYRPFTAITKTDAFALVFKWTLQF
tara:strand:+ start:96 stop:686 length:591 start_codon:yes stop_codon:yes gene_type:complete